MTRAGVFVGLCAVGIPAWWLALHYSPAVRELFVPVEAWRGFQALLLPDLLLAVACAILATQLVRGRFSNALVGVTCGAWAYATAYSLSWTFATGAPLLGSILMVGTLGAFAALWYALVSTRPSGPD